MPFDLAIAHGQPAGVPSVRSRRAISVWLFLVCIMLLGLIALDDVTRLIEAAFSIIGWRPVSGLLPPLSHQGWERLMAASETLRRAMPQKGSFGLAGFQDVIWLEWVRTLWGRAIVAAFLVPLLYFAATHQIRRRLLPGLAVILGLAVLQAAVSWFMPSPNRFPQTGPAETLALLAHLVTTLLLYAAILWVAMTEWVPYPSAVPGAVGLRRLVGLVVILIALTILAGGVVAGMRAGFRFNTFPLMDGHLLPPDYGKLAPVWRNAIGNPAAVQFDHRLLATVTAALALLAAFWGTNRHLMLPQGPRDAMLALGATVVVQYALGVATLLFKVPFDLATLHQVVAVLLLSAALIALHSLRGARPYTL